MPGPGPHYARPADCPEPSRALCCVQGGSLCPVGQRVVYGETAAPRRDLKGVEEQLAQLHTEAGAELRTPLPRGDQLAAAAMRLEQEGDADRLSHLLGLHTWQLAAGVRALARRVEELERHTLGQRHRDTPPHLSCMPTRCHCGLEMFRVSDLDGCTIAAYCTRCKPVRTPDTLDLATAEEGNGRVSIRSSEAHALRASLQALGFQ